MKTMNSIALGGLLLLLGAAPSFAQGVYETPPAPNSSQSMPQPPNSAPPGARTLAPGSTGQGRVGTIGRTRVQPEPAAPSARQPLAR
jgi:hypothetical protein